MKRKILSRTVFIIMLLTVLLVPAIVLAEDNEDDCYLWVGGVAVTEDGAVTGEGITGSVTYDSDENRLTLKNATITGLNVIVDKDNPSSYVTKDSCIFSRAIPLTIELIGDNKVGDKDAAQLGIASDNALIITGSGTLSAAGNSFGMYVEKNCTLDNAKVSAVSGKYSSALVTSKNLILDDSQLTVDSYGVRGITAWESILINNSKVTAKAQDSDAIYSVDGDITVINSKVHAKSVYTSEKEYLMHAIEANNGRIRISHSNIAAYCDGKAAIQAGNLITVGGSDLITPAQGKIGQNEDGYTILDKDGKDAKTVLIQPSKHPCTIAAVGKKVTLKSKAKKLKKAKIISKDTAYTILNNNGKVTFKKVKANKSSGKFTVDSKTGKITVKKGTKTGTYKLTVKISDPGNSTHYGKDTNVIVTIKIKKQK